MGIYKTFYHINDFALFSLALQIFVPNIVQELVTKTIPKKKKCKKVKPLSEEASQIAEERKEVKSKGERERYTQLNTDFQGLARKDKKAFLNGGVKGTFYARMGTINNRNWIDLTEAEEIKMKWQEYMEELYNKSLNDWITTMTWSLT